MLTVFWQPFRHFESGESLGDEIDQRLFARVVVDRTIHESARKTSSSHDNDIPKITIMTFDQFKNIIFAF